MNYTLIKPWWFNCPNLPFEPLKPPSAAQPPEFTGEFGLALLIELCPVLAAFSEIGQDRASRQHLGSLAPQGCPGPVAFGGHSARLPMDTGILGDVAMIS